VNALPDPTTPLRQVLSATLSACFITVALPALANGCTVNDNHGPQVFKRFGDQS
jgi:hypothetical protein